MQHGLAVSNSHVKGMGMSCARSRTGVLLARVPGYRQVPSGPLRPLIAQPRAESKPRSVQKATKLPHRPPPAPAAVAPSTTVPETADVRQNSVPGTLLRLGLAGAILAQLTGPHFKTWLSPDRWDPDRVVIQSRRLWYYSTLLRAGALAGLADFDASQVEELLAAVGPAFQDLKKFWLPEVSGWLFASPSTPEKPQKQLQIHVYGVCFALYALSTFYAAARQHGLPQKDEARAMAVQTFEKLYQLIEDGPDGGIPIESYEPDFKTPLQPEANSNGQNALGHPVGRRSVNVHIHLLEALTAFHEFIGREDAALAAQSAPATRNLAALIVDMKAGPRLQEYRMLDNAVLPYASVPPRDDDVHFLPGHNVESTFLIHDAYLALDETDPTPPSYTAEILEEAESRMGEGPLGERYLPHIYVKSDTDPTGFVIGPEEWQKEVNWWAQMELLNALVHADRCRAVLRSSGDPDVYIQRASATWNLISTRFVATNDGSYMYERLDRETFVGIGNGHSDWKGAYHTTRALVRSLQALVEGLSRGTPAPAAKGLSHGTPAPAA